MAAPNQWDAEKPSIRIVRRRRTARVGRRHRRHYSRHTGETVGRVGRPAGQRHALQRSVVRAVCGRRQARTSGRRRRPDPGHPERRRDVADRNQRHHEQSPVRADRRRRETRGWAVGDSGTILLVQNGSESWQTHTSGTANDLQSVEFAADGKHGWAVGTGGTILGITRNGGRDLAEPSQRESTNALLSVQFANDSRRGWAVGDSGTILVTRNGGENWVQARGQRNHECPAVRAVRQRCDAWQ